MFLFPIYQDNIQPRHKRRKSVKEELNICQYFTQGVMYNYIMKYLMIQYVLNEDFARVVWNWKVVFDYNVFVEDVNLSLHLLSAKELKDREINVAGVSSEMVSFES